MLGLNLGFTGYLIYLAYNQLSYINCVMSFYAILFNLYQVIVKTFMPFQKNQNINSITVIFNVATIIVIIVTSNFLFKAYKVFKGINHLLT